MLYVVKVVACFLWMENDWQRKDECCPFNDAHQCSTSTLTDAKS